MRTPEDWEKDEKTKADTSSSWADAIKRVSSGSYADSDKEAAEEEVEAKSADDWYKALHRVAENGAPLDKQTIDKEAKERANREAADTAAAGRVEKWRSRSQQTTRGQGHQHTLCEIHYRQYHRGPGVKCTSIC